MPVVLKFLLGVLYIIAFVLIVLLVEDTVYIFLEDIKEKKLSGDFYAGLLRSGVCIFLLGISLCPVVLHIAVAMD